MHSVVFRQGIASAQSESGSGRSAASGVSPGCLLRDDYFENEVWAKVAERTCIRCHHSKGEAAESAFLLSKPPEASTDASRSADWLQQNRKAFESLAESGSDEPARLLIKATGGLDHGGGEVIDEASTEYQILARYVRRLNKHATAPESEVLAQWDAKSVKDYPPLFEGVSLLTPSRLLRRVTLSLCGRLPTIEERQRINQDGLAALNPILDDLMREEAFYERLKEAFNDIFLTIGIEDNAESLLSYDHFEHTRLWYQKHDLSHIPEAEQERARWKLADVYREALLREPLELITYIVRNDRPFTELVTADYIMVSPYSARGYGLFESLKGEFKNPDDAFEYIPARLNALKNRAGKIQESPTGLYPHAGLLSMFHYLRRYPSTETNRNRLRARMVYQHFLGIDIMESAPRSTDASAVAEKFDIPTMQAADCVICHRTIDPVAGIFQDFDFEGYLGPRKEGWYEDMFVTGFEGEVMPAEERWRAPQWLAERIAKDSRFAVAMVEHVYYMLFGRRAMQAPKDINDPLFGAKRHAYLAQRRMIDECAVRFVDSGHNLKEVIKAIIATDFYRVDSLATTELSPERAAVLDDLGLVRLLSPEQLTRKLIAIFGKEWNRLEGEMKILYGGIDSITVTERNGDPSGAMGAIQRMMANDVACYNVARDFRQNANDRLLFPGIEPDVLPGSEQSEQKIRDAIVHLHQRLLGQECATDDPEVERTLQLWTGILKDANASGRYEPRETYYCGGRDEYRVEDPHYTIRAWRAVVTYLLRQHEFLYE